MRHAAPNARDCSKSGGPPRLTKSGHSHFEGLLGALNFGAPSDAKKWQSRGEIGGARARATCLPCHPNIKVLYIFRTFTDKWQAGQGARARDQFAVQERRGAHCRVAGERARGRSFTLENFAGGCGRRGEADATFRFGKWSTKLKSRHRGIAIRRRLAEMWNE